MKKQILGLGITVMLISSTALFAEGFSLTNIVGKLKGKTAGELPAVPCSLTLRVTCYGVNMRTSPSPSASIICELSQGTHVSFSSTDIATDENGNTWWAVTVIDGAYAGQSGWVISYCLTEETNW